MYHFFVSPDQIDKAGKTVTIVGTDVNHIKNVLRMRPGEEIAVSNGEDTNEYRCAIRSLSDDHIDCELRFIKEDNVELPSKIYLFQGLPKSDKMETVIQKTVELGVCEIIPVNMVRSIVKLDEKKIASRVLRWQQIAESAAKQSKRAIIPHVHEPVSFKEALKMAQNMDVKLIPYEMAEGMEHTRNIVNGITPGQSVGFIIGPEGGIDDTELDLAKNAGFECITLGKRILRTETAGMTLMSILMYHLEKD
ncbi:MAG: 16S rRNA (uracil(1498)-N(3))-methyltransferase [Lachnospiraceae bacterium]|nr:16S rRNA (uracil(1498)-N(3))-methyltransferase [Lachnospiraceae bacterium]